MTTGLRSWLGRIALLVVGASGIANFLPMPALACDMGRLSPRAIPGNGQAAPRNAHVRLFLGPEPPRAEGSPAPRHGSGDPDDPVFLLRTDVRPPRLVPARRVDYGGESATSGFTSMRVVELVPTTLLDANATFTLFWRAGVQDMFSSTFLTSDGLDASPPSWEGAVATPTWERYPGWAPLMRSPRMPWIEVTPSALHDDMTQESDLVVGVFTPSANGNIDFDGPPALLLPLRPAGERVIPVTRGQTLEPPTLIWGPDVPLAYPGTEQPPAWLQRAIAGSEGVSWFGRTITLSRDAVPFVPAPFWRGPARRVTDDYVSRALPAVLVLGENDTCGGYFETLHLDEQRPQVSVGLRALDMAGQKSSPVAIAVDLRHPIVPWRHVGSAPW